MGTTESVQSVAPSLREELWQSGRQAIIGTAVLLLVVVGLYAFAPATAERFGPGAIIISIAHVVGIVGIKFATARWRRR